ncbi:hypothetical protein AMTR_s00069p00049300 [Amborella trichopoda]|uniref:Dof zinc finger protein n=2 Tax=Amborella trichopoda TaxID=13333 RepID=U5D0Z6_AMBTC|nr:hypothetical protein AMTR_s00069p00049300 [Amborella trichopoda]
MKAVEGDPWKKPIEEEPELTPSPSSSSSSAKARPQKDKALNCPRCNSSNTKFCYYNNYSLSQPRYFCRACKRHWTEGGTLRNVPVGGSSRKPKKPSSSSSSSRKFNETLISQETQGPNLPVLPLDGGSSITNASYFPGFEMNNYLGLGPYSLQDANSLDLSFSIGEGPNMENMGGFWSGFNGGGGAWSAQLPNYGP